MEKQWRWTSPSLYNSWDLNLYWQSILTPQEISKKQNQLVRNWRLKVSSPKNISGTHAKHGVRAETNEQNKAGTSVSPPYVPRRIKVTFSLFLCCWYLCCAWCFCKSVAGKKHPLPNTPSTRDKFIAHYKANNECKKKYKTNKLKIKLYIAICCRGNVDFTWKCLVAVKYKSTQSRVLCIGLVGETSGSKELRASLGMFTRSCGSQIRGFGHIAFLTCMAVMMMKINICICICICLCIFMYTKCSAQFLSGAYQRGCNADSQISESSR